MEIFHFIARKSKVNIYSDMEARERCQALTEYDPLVSTVPEAHLHFCLPTIWFFTFLVFLYSTNSRFFFLMLPQTGFYPLKKKKMLTFTSSRRFFFQIFSFFKYHHTIYGKEGKPSVLAEECVMKISKTHTHISKWKEYRGTEADMPVKWKESQEDWFASSLTWKEKSTRTQ